MSDLSGVIRVNVPGSLGLPAVWDHALLLEVPGEAHLQYLAVGAPGVEPDLRHIGRDPITDVTLDIKNISSYSHKI